MLSYSNHYIYINKQKYFPIYSGKCNTQTFLKCITIMYILILYIDIPQIARFDIFTSPPIGGGRGIVMPMSVCPCFRKISMCNISVISQPIIMKLDIHIEYGYSVTDKYFQNFRSKVKVIGHRNVFP